MSDTSALTLLLTQSFGRPIFKEGVETVAAINPRCIVSINVDEAKQMAKVGADVIAGKHIPLSSQTGSSAKHCFPETDHIGLRTKWPVSFDDFAPRLNSSIEDNLIQQLSQTPHRGQTL